MNFQAHLQGGLVAGSIAVGVALGTGYAEWQSDAWQRFCAELRKADRDATADRR